MPSNVQHIQHLMVYWSPLMGNMRTVACMKERSGSRWMTRAASSVRVDTSRFDIVTLDGAVDTNFMLARTLSSGCRVFTAELGLIVSMASSISCSFCRAVKHGTRHVSIKGHILPPPRKNSNKCTNMHVHMYYAWKSVFGKCTRGRIVTVRRSQNWPGPYLA